MASSFVMGFVRGYSLGSESNDWAPDEIGRTSDRAADFTQAEALSPKAAM